MTEQFRTLSKSDFKAARSCAAKLYYRELWYPNTKADDDYLRMLAEGGYMVETLAKLHYPDGVALEYGRDPLVGAAATREAFRTQNVTVFEATLLAGHRLARADIIQKRGNEYRLIEVKAKSFDSKENTDRLTTGGSNFFRGKRKPFPISEKWREYLEDVAFQVGVLSAMIPGASVRPYLCLVDKAATTRIDGLPNWFKIERRESPDGKARVHRATFTGDLERAREDRCVVEVDVSAEVAELLTEVEPETSRFEASLLGELRKLPAPLGFRCRDCEYRVEPGVQPSGFRECWGALADVTPSVLDLYQGGRLKGSFAPLVEELLHKKKASLLDVPEGACTKADGSVGLINARQLVQIRHTSSGQVWVGDHLRPTLQTARYPLHFIDFETSRLALPYHAGMRPYGLVAFQWSCHSINRPGGRPLHSEWINTEDAWPNGKFAHALREAIGEEGTVLAWATHEGSTMKEILRELPAFGQANAELDEWIKGLTESDRILDLNQVTRENFFHPAMGGRTSIKVVLDALWSTDALMRERCEQITGHATVPGADPYAALPPIVINGVQQEVIEGTGAMRAYQAMMYGVERDDDEARRQWRELLLQYCGLDSLAMVLIWEYWERALRL